MTELNPITVRVGSLPSGPLFLWGESGRRSPADPQVLKGYLFGWHEPSFYGTFIETAERDGQEGLLLPPGEALNYFCDPPCLRHANLEYGPEFERLKRVAPAIRQALDTGKFMPDYNAWKKGKVGWKLDLPEPEGELAEADSFAAPWIQALITEWANSHPDARESLERMKKMLPAFGENALPADLWMDEEDWLAAIGWSIDPAPFRTCLQLAEPAPELPGSWKLTVLLQNRSRPEQLLEWTPERPWEEQVPKEWREFRQRAARDIRRWQRLAPWLCEAAEDAPPSAGSSAEPVNPDGGEAGSGRLPLLKRQLGSNEAWRFLTEASMLLAEAGYAVFLPAWWDRIRRLKPRLRAKIKSSAGSAPQSLFGLQQLMQFDWRLALGDVEITEAEFRRLLEQNQRLVQIRGQWVQLDPAVVEQIRRMMKKIGGKKGLTFRDVLEIHLLGEAPPDAGEPEAGQEERLKMEIELNDTLGSMLRRLTHAEKLPAVSVPASFRGTLRPYQNDGVSWLLFLRGCGLGGCLADDMGLGKTVQWITYLVHVKEHEKPDAPSLLICPTSVLGNWQKEIERFAPKLTVYLHYGPHRHRSRSFRETAARVDLVLTTYTLAHLDAEELGSVEWNSICLDEAQNIKNAYTKQAAAIRRLEGRHRVAMTGTPIENRLTELWSIFDFINPGYLGSLNEFSRRFSSAIEKNGDREKTAQVQRLVRPFLMRREKKDPAISLDLPEKSESKTYVPLTAEQGSLYENYIRDLFERLDRLSPMERRGMILTALTKLKQLCNHPALLLKENGHLPEPDRSNKFKRLLEMVSELRAEGDRCLIFTQFVETGHMLQRTLERQQREPVQFLHGGTPRVERERMITRFQDESLPRGEGCGIFILSLKAGGTGLNLTAANHVFHFDRWWNPAVENQATDRAFRIGQTRHVQVYKFITLGTLEEKIDEMIERKTGLSRQIVGGGENWITELSTDELRELFALRREWIEA
jgi:SNF2 family DNA or RNA helicase